jgi:thymidylate synthase (FAD)
MKIIHQTAELLTKVNQVEILKALELYGRNCYKSEHKISATSYKAFINLLLERKHLSVLEHVSLTVRLITDRGMLAEITRHRLASYSVESTRYVKYNDISFVWPFYKDGMMKENNFEMGIWQKAMLNAEESYKEMLSTLPPQIARSVLPTSLATDIVMTCNLREWLYILNLRRASGVHPQMIELMNQIYKIFHKVLPLVFNKETCLYQSVV